MKSYITQFMKQLILALLSFLLLGTFALADEDTKLYLNGNGENNSTVILDSSDSNHQVALHGDVVISTQESKYGGSSIKLDGSGDFLEIADSEDWNFGSGDFTIDFWINPTDLTELFRPLSQTVHNSTDEGWNILISGTLRFTWSTDGADEYMITSGSMGLAVGQWSHVAIVRNGNTLTIYCDGVQKGSGTITGSIYNCSQPLLIGVFQQTTPGNYTGYFNGYLDNIRVTKGTALWTADFQPPGPPPTVVYTASASEVNAGDPLTLTWDIQEADSWLFEPDIGAIDPNGSTIIYPNVSKTYKLTASNAEGEVSKELQVTVTNGYNQAGKFTVEEKVGIGVLNPQHALEVKGVIKAQEVLVTMDGWADYVFDEGYDLKSLDKVEAFIRKNKRLPDIPSAQKIKEEGLGVSDILTKQMQKIEELTLYIIKLEKMNKDLEKRVEAIEKNSQKRPIIKPYRR